MSSSRGRFVLLGALTAVLAVAGCGSDASDDDDDGGEGGEDGMVLGGGTGGGSAANGGTSNAATGGTDAATGGSSNPTTGGSAGSAGAATGGTGDVGTGGASGTAGTSGKGGASGKGGTGGTAGSPAMTANIGAECEADADCGTGLTCITTSSTIFGPGGPAGGLCSLVCASDEECGNTAYCVPFEENATTGYCIEACDTGSAGEPKCHQRDNLACSLLALIPTETACESIDDCGTAQLCDTEEGVCGDIVPGCIPTCAGDFDCESGQYCSFQTGLCTVGAATGLEIGDLCDPQAATDPCAGFCSVTNEDGSEGVCSALCTLNANFRGCGWDGEGSADAACLFGTLLSPEGDLGVGDVAICGALCDCNDDCNVEDQRCVDETGGDVLSLFGRNGYCRPLASDETESDSIACE